MDKKVTVRLRPGQVDALSDLEWGYKDEIFRCLVDGFLSEFRLDPRLPDKIGAGKVKFGIVNG
jgi:hypothetical protein